MRSPFVLACLVALSLAACGRREAAVPIVVATVTVAPPAVETPSAAVAASAIESSAPPLPHGCLLPSGDGYLTTAVTTCASLGAAEMPNPMMPTDPLFGVSGTRSCRRGDEFLTIGIVQRCADFGAVDGARQGERLTIPSLDTADRRETMRAMMQVQQALGPQSWQGASEGAAGGAGGTHVNGYYRSNGTYVRGYTRGGR